MFLVSSFISLGRAFGEWLVSTVVSGGLTKELFRNNFTTICFAMNFPVADGEFLQFLSRYEYIDVLVRNLTFF